MENLKQSESSNEDKQLSVLITMSLPLLFIVIAGMTGFLGSETFAIIGSGISFVFGVAFLVLAKIKSHSITEEFLKLLDEKTHCVRGA